ncbi:MAG: hypothetical protein V4651_01840 [Bacteroidota bacterium]
MTEHLNIKLTYDSYAKRVKSTFGWTTLPYIILAIICMFKTTLNEFLLILVFLVLLFVLDYNRRLRWIRSVISTLETSSTGISLTYFEKDKPYSIVIPWNNLIVTKGSTFTKGPKKYISIKNSTEEIAVFYADTPFENNEIENLFKNLNALKIANTVS